MTPLSNNVLFNVRRNIATMKESAEMFLLDFVSYIFISEQTNGIHHHKVTGMINCMASVSCM